MCANVKDSSREGKGGGLEMRGCCFWDGRDLNANADDEKSNYQLEKRSRNYD